eukprot:TRINITY_DN40979_c0_g1_i1.p1 TRINITY_DN40979_c0_g1~~TRINITY_DN40979_c0_g1_i1.p1  ORF type:complete len:303 (+),score=65.16 TRINITY_DN40979_c0_g1_i1:44-910(+)
MARSLSALLALALASIADASVAVPDCATAGKGYNDPKLNKTVNGNFVANATACQDACKATVFCAFWTWYNNTGGCWLQGDASVQSITSADLEADVLVVSGPVRCDILEATPSVSDHLNNATGAGFPWYAWVLIGLGVAAAALFCILCICCKESKKKKKTGRGAKVNKDKDIDAEAQKEEAPLMAARDVPLIANEVPQASLAMPQVPSVAMPQAMPMAMPMQMVQYPQVSYVYSGAQPGVMSGAQPAMYVAQPMMMPQANNLFDQLDVNGDGVLSPEELQQMAQAQPGA